MGIPRRAQLLELTQLFEFRQGQRRGNQTPSAKNQSRLNKIRTPTEEIKACPEVVLGQGLEGPKAERLPTPQAQAELVLAGLPLTNSEHLTVRHLRLSPRRQPRSGRAPRAPGAGPKSAASSRRRRVPSRCYRRCRLRQPRRNGRSLARATNGM